MPADCHECRFHARELMRAIDWPDERVWNAALDRSKAHMLEHHAELSARRRAFFRGFMRGLDPRTWPEMFRRWFRRGGDRG